MLATEFAKDGPRVGGLIKAAERARPAGPRLFTYARFSMLLRGPQRRSKLPALSSPTNPTAATINDHLPTSEVKRAAIYSIQSPDPATGKYRMADFVHCARHARRAGYRVVALALDDTDHRISDVGGRMQNLVERMYEGEFDVIFVKSPISDIMTFDHSIAWSAASRRLL